MKTNSILLASADAATSFAPLTDWSSVVDSEHLVQFYENDDYLERSVCAFIGAGLGTGGSAIVIATESHRNGLEQQLRASGFDITALQASGHYVSLDAAETLSQLMVNGVPDEARFAEVVGSLVAHAGQNGRRLRAFGEMVALLWDDGNGDAAIRLEQLWNELAEVHSFALLCAYPMDGFCGESNGQPFAHICNAHSRVIPAESYAAKIDTDDRLRSVSLLQQKAASLDVEVTERKHAERALVQREKELADFLENATEGIHQVSGDGRILWANKAELRLLGYTAEEYFGRHISEFHADPAVFSDIMERLKRREELHGYEARLRHKDGSIRYVSINSSVYWEEGRFVYTRCFTHDITDRKRAAEIMEQTVAERTSQLQETIGELEAFSYSISHDMRAPLRSMRGFADILMREYSETLPSECRAYLERIASAGERMDRLIQDVLTFSRVARNELNLESVSLDHLVHGIIECYPNLQQPYAEIAIEGHLPHVLGNVAALTQCFSNLLGNAVKFMPGGTQPMVRVSAQSAPRRQGAGPSFVRVNVQDNGIGIPKESREKVFAIFQRLNKGYEGTGIGLAIVKKAAERMGGRVGVESEPGEGSTFWLELIAAEAP